MTSGATFLRDRAESQSESADGTAVRKTDKTILCQTGNSGLLDWFYKIGTGGGSGLVVKLMTAGLWKCWIRDTCHK